MSERRSVNMYIPISFQYRERKNAPIKHCNQPVPLQSMNKSGRRIWKNPRQKAYIAYITQYVQDHMPKGFRPLQGCINVKELVFAFPRPHYHYSQAKGKEHVVKDRYRDIFFMDKKPDRDNLEKPFWDAIKGKLIEDDCKIVCGGDWGKIYTTDLKDFNADGYISFELEEIQNKKPGVKNEREKHRKLQFAKVDGMQTNRNPKAGLRTQL